MDTDTKAQLSDLLKQLAEQVGKINKLTKTVLNKELKKLAIKAIDEAENIIEQVREKLGEKRYTMAEIKEKFFNGKDLTPDKCPECGNVNLKMSCSNCGWDSTDESFSDFPKNK